MTKLRNSFLALGLAIVASLGFVQPANASTNPLDFESRESESIQIFGPAIKASNAAKLSFAKTDVVTTHSNPVSTTDDTVVAVQSSKPEATTTAAYAAPVAKNEPVKPVVPAPAPIAKAPVAAPAPVAPPVVPQAAASGRGAAILASAYGQLGITQDCTAMVERALGSVGIITGDIAPLDFLRYGTPVSSPQPGDLIVSAGHVAVYAGNGMAISGGWNGSQTAVHPAKYAPGVFIRV